MAVIPGTRLGGYEITAKLGEGGMGAALRARDTKLDRDVAIKILTDAFAHDAERRPIGRRIQSCRRRQDRPALTWP